MVATTPLSSSLVNKPKNVVNKKTLVQANIKKSYVQASKTNISLRVKNVFHIKDAFPELSADDVGRIIVICKSTCLETTSLQ